MSRRLYKAKADHNDEWVFGYYLEVAGVPFILPEGKPLNAIVQVRPETVCQEIGMTDAEKVKVFEGDVLVDKYGDTGEVRFGWFLGLKAFYLFGAVDELTDEDLIVIKNIHDKEEIV